MTFRSLTQNETYYLIELQKMLFREASYGSLLLEEEEFLWLMKDSIDCPSYEKLVDHAIELGVIQKTLRKFSDIRTISYVSLKLEILSY